MMKCKKGLCAILTLALLLGLSSTAFADAGSESSALGDETYVAYTVEEIKALTSPIPLGNSVIILDKTHNFTSDDYYGLVAAENAQSLPAILHPDTLETDIFKAYENGAWPNEDNQTAIDALNALANRTTDAEYKALALDVASAIKDNAPGKILDKLAGDQTSDKTDAKTEKPETNQQPTTVVSGGKFSDVDDNAWYATAVNYMASTGILNGYPDGTFKPNQAVTEAEYAAILWHLANVTDPLKAATTPYGWTYGAVDTENGKIHYWGSGKYEVVDHWGACYLYGAYRATWTSMKPDGPNGVAICNAAVRRGEAVSGIVRLLGNLGMLDDEVKPISKVWTSADIPDWDAVCVGSYDDEAVSKGAFHAWDKEKILQAYNYGVISGIDEMGTCNPAGTLTRAELCQILYNSQLNKPRDLVVRPGHEQHGHVGIG